MPEELAHEILGFGQFEREFAADLDAIGETESDIDLRDQEDLRIEVDACARNVRRFVEEGVDGREDLGKRLALPGEGAVAKTRCRLGREPLRLVTARMTVASAMEVSSNSGGDVAGVERLCVGGEIFVELGDLEEEGELVRDQAQRGIGENGRRIGAGLQHGEAMAVQRAGDRGRVARSGGD